MSKLTINHSLLLLFIAAVLGIALGCAGSATTELAAGGIRGTGGGSITGAIDDSTGIAKARYSTSDVLTGTATGLTTGDVFAVSISGRNYVANVSGDSAYKIEIKNGSVVIFSKVVAGLPDSGFKVEAKINAVTHVQSQMALQRVAGGTAATTALQEVSQLLLGNSIPTESQVSVSQVTNNDLNMATKIAIYQYLTSLAFSTQNSNLVSNLSDSFFAADFSSASTAYVKVLNEISDSTMASVFASALESVQNSGIISLAAFLDLKGQITNTVLNTALSNAAQSPVFGSLDAVSAASPGVLFSYTFPSATTVDAQGISGYSSSFRTNPAGTFSKSNNNLTLNYFPVQADVGQSFTYTLTATGKNGKSSSATISITVKSPSVAAQTRKQIGVSGSNNGAYRPLLGPEVVGSNFYILAQYNGSSYRLEKYSLSDLTATGNDGVLSFTTMNLLSGTGTPLDMKLSSSRIYVATTNQGVLSYDITDFNATSPTSTASGMNVSALSVDSNYIYGLNTTTRDVYRASLDLATVEQTSGSGSLSEKATSISASQLGVYDTHLYLAGGNALSFYSSAASLFLSDANFSATISVPTFQSSSLASSLSVIDSTAVSAVTIASNAAQVNAFTGINLSTSVTNMLSFAGRGYTPEGSTSFLSYSLQNSAEAVTATGDTSTVVYYDNVGSLHPIASEASNAIWVFMPGQYSASGLASLTATSDNSWYIRVYKVSAE